MPRKLSAIALVVGLVVDAAVLAQAPPGAHAPASYSLWEFGTIPRPAFKQVLLGQHAVLEELKLTETQKKAMEDAPRRQMEKLQKARREITDRQKFLAAREAIVNETVTAILECLEPSQRDRLDQIQLQSQGPLAFMSQQTARMAMDGPNRPLAQRLKLTDDQVKRAQEIAEQGEQEIGKAAAVPIVLDPKAGAPTPESIRKLVQTPEFKAAKQKTRAAARKAWASVMERIEQVLTESQRTAYREMLGPPFDMLRIRFSPNESDEDADMVASALNVGGAGGGGGGQRSDPNFRHQGRPALRTRPSTLVSSSTRPTTTSTRPTADTSRSPRSSATTAFRSSPTRRSSTKGFWPRETS